MAVEILATRRGKVTEENIFDLLQKFQIINHGDAESQSFSLFFSQCLRDSMVQKGTQCLYPLLIQEVLERPQSDEL